MKTVLITGCSTGFGLATARTFLEREWRVIATMRNPADSELQDVENCRVLPLDVTDQASIDSAVAQAGEIDVLVNNAGIGWLNALEGTSLDTARQIFETNLFGTIAMMQAVLPQFRERRSGVVVNVSSSTTLKSLPLLSVYTASKAAINHLTQSVAIELAEFGIRTHLILPGAAPSTSFSQNARTRISGQGGFPPAYEQLAETVMEQLQANAEGAVTHPDDVAEAVWRAATDPDCSLRLPAGADAIALAGEGNGHLAA